MPEGSKEVKFVAKNRCGNSSEFYSKVICIISSSCFSNYNLSLHDIFSRSDKSQSFSQSLGTMTMLGEKSINKFPDELISRSFALIFGGLYYSTEYSV